MLTFVCLDIRVGAAGFVNAGFQGPQTLLDADVAIIDPTRILDDLPGKDVSGVPQRMFFQTEKLFEWRRLMAKRGGEVERLLNQGKVVIGMLAPLKSLTVLKDMLHPQEQTPFTNYDWLPEELRRTLVASIQEGTGQDVRLVNPQHPFAPYYAAYRKQLCYRAYLMGEAGSGDHFLLNKADCAVGASWRHGKGWLVLLPYPADPLAAERFAAAMVQCAQPLLNVEEEEDAPAWAATRQVPGESSIASRMAELKEQVIDLEGRIGQLSADRASLAGFRKLLYGKGHPLQDTVVESLRLLGFEADTVRLDNVDRDVVMRCAEGRAIAEVEGKDESAIDLTKFNQLVRVWTEDFATGTEHAHPVLVGNAHRLLPPEERGEPFTEKVVQAAKRLRAGLLTTTDLFKAVVHVLNHPQDEEFKRKCRQAILNADGTLVSFPSLGDEAGDDD